jgi:hypothetical protein
MARVGGMAAPDESIPGAVSLHLNGTGHGADLVAVEGVAEVVPDYASGAFSTAQRITPTRWRVSP